MLFGWLFSPFHVQSFLPQTTWCRRSPKKLAEIDTVLIDWSMILTKLHDIRDLHYRKPLIANFFLAQPLVSQHHHKCPDYLRTRVLRITHPPQTVDPPPPPHRTIDPKSLIFCYDQLESTSFRRGVGRLIPSVLCKEIAQTDRDTDRETSAHTYRIQSIRERIWRRGSADYNGINTASVRLWWTEKNLLWLSVSFLFDCTVY